MSFLDTVVQYLFGGPITQGFGVVESRDQYGNVLHTEQGIDVGLPAGTTVNLLNTGKFLGTDRGYRDLFLDPNGFVEQYQHIVSNPFVIGQTYAKGTQVGTVASVSDTPSGYSTTGPHLEFAVYSSLAQALTFNNAVDPTNVLESAYNNVSPGTNPTPNPSSNPTPAPTQGTPEPGPPLGSLPSIPNPITSAGNAFSTIWDTLRNGVGTVGSVPGQAGNEIDTALNYLKQPFQRILLVLLFAVIGLLLIAALLRGNNGQSGTTTKTIIA